MIRHARLPLTAAIAPLAIAMVESAFRTLLVAAVGATSLAQPRWPATTETTVALAAIAPDTQEEQSAAFPVAANP